jgi:hypothetical protein
MGVNGHDQVQMGHDSDSFKNIAAGVQPSLAANALRPAHALSHNLPSAGLGGKMLPAPADRVSSS